MEKTYNESQGIDNKSNLTVENYRHFATYRSRCNMLTQTFHKNCIRQTETCTQQNIKNTWKYVNKTVDVFFLVFLDYTFK